MRNAFLGVLTALAATLIYWIAALLLSYFVSRSPGAEPPGGWLKGILTIPIYMTLLSSPITVTLGAGLGFLLPRIAGSVPRSTGFLLAAAIAFLASLIIFGSIAGLPPEAGVGARLVSGLREALYSALVAVVFLFLRLRGA
jgi:hypothetical protein